MLSKLRSNWILGANPIIKRIPTKCVTCWCTHRSAGQQQVADIPRDRVLHDNCPFTYTGLNYFGTFEVKQGWTRVTRNGVTFTCLTIQTVHLALASSLYTYSFINALCHFVATRGQVKFLCCHNGANFVVAEHNLNSILKECNTLEIENMLH